jgi:hypothetical protein
MPADEGILKQKASDHAFDGSNFHKQVRLGFGIVFPGSGTTRHVNNIRMSLSRIPE